MTFFGHFKNVLVYDRKKTDVINLIFVKLRRWQ